MKNISAFQGKPQVILIGSPSEKTPGVPIDPGHMELEPHAREFFSHDLIGICCQRLEGLVQNRLKLIFVRQKPGAFIIEG